MRGTRIRAFFLAGLSLCGAAAAQTPSADQQRSTDLSAIRNRISALEEKLEQSRKKVATLSEELARLDWRLEIAQKQGELVAATRAGLSRRLGVSRGQREASAEASTRLASALTARARVLQRFGRFGYFRVLLEARDARAFLGGIERLDALARRDGRLLADYRAAQARLERDLVREEALKAQMDQLYAHGRVELASIASLRRQREALLAREKNDSALRSAQVAALSDKAARLEGLLQRLSKLAREEPLDPSGGIRPWKGVLDWPARGSLVETFGRHRHPRFDAWTISNGIALALPAGTPVRAVYSGKAVYAQWLAEYGNLVILDHGDGVLTVYAWLQSIAIPAGSYVPAATAIGAAGTGPGHDEPGLYFEVRDRQKASDPVAWLR